MKLTQSFSGEIRPVIAAAKPQSSRKNAAKSSRKRSLDYTRRHVVVALLAAGRSRAQAAKYVRISPEMLQRVAECNSRFRYDMRKAELDYETRKARRRLKRSLMDYASPDHAEERAAAKAAAKAQAEAEAQAKETAARIKASLQSDAEAWLKINPEGRSIFHGREEMPSLAELETLARSFPPLPELPEFQLPKFAFDLPKVDFDALSETGKPSPSQSPKPLATASELCSESHPESLVPSPEPLNSSPEPPAPLASPFKEAIENKALARVRAQKTWQYFESRRKYRRVRIVAAPKQRPINQRLRNAPNPKRPEIKLVVCGLPSPQPSPSGRGRISAGSNHSAERSLQPRHASPGTLHSSLSRSPQAPSRLARVRRPPSLPCTFELFLGRAAPKIVRNQLPKVVPLAALIMLIANAPDRRGHGSPQAAVDYMYAGRQAAFELFESGAGYPRACWKRGEPLVVADDFGFGVGPKAIACADEAAGEHFLALSVEDGFDRCRFGRRLGRDDFERVHADDRRAGEIREHLGRGHADAQARERAGTDRERNQLEVGGGPADFAPQLFESRRERLRAALRGIQLELDEQLVAVQRGDAAGLIAGFESQNTHGRHLNRKQNSTVSGRSWTLPEALQFIKRLQWVNFETNLPVAAPPFELTLGALHPMLVRTFEEKRCPRPPPLRTRPALLSAA